MIIFEEIYKKANSIVKSCEQDTLKIARELGIHLHFLDNLNDLLGMHTYRHKEAAYSSELNMEYLIMQNGLRSRIGQYLSSRSCQRNEPLGFVLFDTHKTQDMKANAPLT